jgi:hypothetical protein
LFENETRFFIKKKYDYERTLEDIMVASARHIHTEVGWQVAEGMEYLIKFYTFATEGDTLFDQEFCLPIKEREQFDMEGKVQQTICSCIEHLLHDEPYEDVGKQSKKAKMRMMTVQKMLKQMKRKKRKKRKRRSGARPRNAEKKVQSISYYKGALGHKE